MLQHHTPLCYEDQMKKFIVKDVTRLPRGTRLRPVQPTSVIELQYTQSCFVSINSMEIILQNVVTKQSNLSWR